MTTAASPVCRALRQVTFIDSQDQQAPANSPLSIARRMAEVPLCPVMTWIGSLRAAFKILAALSGVTPGGLAPHLTGVFEAIHLSTLVMPLALVRPQTTSSPRAA